MASGDLWHLLWQWTDSITGKQWTTGVNVQQANLAPTTASVEPIQVALWTAIKPYYDSSTVLSKTSIRKILPNDGTLFETVEAAPGTKSSVGPLPPDTALVVTLRTALAGRSYRGRCYLPAPSSAEMTSGGVMTNADAEAIADAFEVMDAALAALLNQQLVVIYSKRHNKTSVTTITRVNQYRCDVRFRRQGRRNLRAPAYATG